jgi:hypothetical protein
MAEQQWPPLSQEKIGPHKKREIFNATILKETLFYFKNIEEGSF